MSHVWHFLLLFSEHPHTQCSINGQETQTASSQLRDTLQLDCHYH